MSRAFVTGGLGFVGYHLRKRLQLYDIPIVVYDRHEENDVLNYDHLVDSMKGSTIVYHLAALADVRSSLIQAREQLAQNCQGTLHVLEAMRECNINQIAFTSSAVVYGNQTGLLTEDAALGQQTSVYGAMKLSSESLIQAYCHGYNMRADIFRLVSLVGEGYRHGNLLDFYKKLQIDPTKIHVLGTGKEKKYYTYAGDVIDGIVRAVNSTHKSCEVWNISGDTPVTIDEVLDAACNGRTPIRTYEQTTWAGDLPSLVLDTTKLRSLGWTPTVSIPEGLRRTVAWFKEAL